MLPISLEQALGIFEKEDNLRISQISNYFDFDLLSKKPNTSHFINTKLKNLSKTHQLHVSHFN